jgi:uncharacterized FAD-dependent dehydrogenase
MIASPQLVLDLDSAYDQDAIRREAARVLNCELERVKTVRVRRRSLDARGSIRMNLLCDVWLDEDAPPEETPRIEYSKVRGPHQVVIVGCGPAGMFAALRLIELGIKPVVVERGKEVQARRRDLARINREGIVNPESNYCFGEGGAGTFSDGKLYTRVKDKAAIAQVLETLVAHGAHPDILVDAHPHIGSNKLPKIVAAMRDSIRSAAAKFTSRRVTSPISSIDNGRMRAVVLADDAKSRAMP